MVSSPLLGVRLLRRSSSARARIVLFPATTAILGTRSVSVAAQKTLARLQKIKDEIQPKLLFQRLDYDQCLKFSHTLGITTTGGIWAPETHQLRGYSTSLPAGWHFLYFTPHAGPDRLRSDGAFDDFSPGGYFPRRMWAGGTIKWNNENTLLLDSVAKETALLKDFKRKERRGDQEMILVNVSKEFHNLTDWSIRETRNWVYLPPAATSDIKIFEIPPEPDVVPEEEGAVHTVEYRHDIPTLFRFSALTFNAHQIHYNPKWARDVEGHPAPIVHGPLNVILMLNQWRHWLFEEGTWEIGNNQMPLSMEYRNMRPLYAGERYWSFITDVKNTKPESSCKVKMKKGNGEVAVEATIKWTLKDYTGRKAQT